jgi:hypothetical protein
MKELPSAERMRKSLSPVKVVSCHGRDCTVVRSDRTDKFMHGLRSQDGVARFTLLTGSRLTFASMKELDDYVSRNSRQSADR